MKQVGQYLIERLISTGGMSTLYLGRHREMGRQVAIKQLHPHLARDQALVRRFEREAKILGGLRHHNIVDIIDFFRHQDSFYIVLEYIEGRSLKDLLEDRRPLPATAAAHIGAQLARGLGYAHGRGVVHRDIKPANILFTALGVAKITDFGLAFAKEALGMTDPGTFFGTPAYLAPEQARGEKGDARSDLFSLGVLLYEMLSGANPFAGASASECIDRVLRLSPPKLSGKVPGLPPGLARLVSELMDKDPTRRPGSAEEAAEKLEPYAFVTGEGVARLLADPKGYQIRREDQQALETISRRERKSQTLNRSLAWASALAVAAAAAWSAYRWGLPAARNLLTRPGPLPSLPAVDSPAVARPIVPEQSGRIRISGTTGAKIYLDGATKGRIPFSIEGVKPGRLLLRAELEGYQPYEKTVTIQPRQTLDLVVEMAPAAREPGYLALAVTPWAEVYVDGRLVDRTPLSGPMKLEAGRRQLLLRHPNRLDYAREVEIKPGDTLRLEVAMPRAWGYLAVTAVPWARVFVDGEQAGTTPLANPLKLSIGQHEVRLEGPGGSQWRETVSLAEGETLTVRVEMK